MLVLIVAGALVLMLVAWRIQPRRTYTPDPDDPLDDGRPAPVDREELERAEREVRDWDPGVAPGEDRPGDDWGPGSPRP